MNPAGIVYNAIWIIISRDLDVHMTWKTTLDMDTIVIHVFNIIITSL